MLASITFSLLVLTLDVYTIRVPMTGRHMASRGAQTHFRRSTTMSGVKGTTSVGDIIDTLYTINITVGGKLKTVMADSGRYV